MTAPKPHGGHVRAEGRPLGGLPSCSVQGCLGSGVQGKHLLPDGREPPSTPDLSANELSRSTRLASVLSPSSAQWFLFLPVVDLKNIHNLKVESYVLFSGNF